MDCEREAGMWGERARIVRGARKWGLRELGERMMDVREKRERV